ncbi:MAG TPA: hypothetical protein VFC63_15940 [Blastocatellia bacterium]|nr:hypothetical protein [Blastocatellia bacterium]
MGCETLKTLSDDAVQTINGLSYDSNAEIIYCTLPLGGIFWSDELPRFRFLAFKGDDHNLVLRLFAIRIKIWNGETLNEEESSLWQSTIEQLPDWSFFKRLVLTEEQRLAHQAAESDAEKFFEELINAADEGSVSTKDGITNFSMTIKIKD